MNKTSLYICNYFPGQNGEGYRSFNQIKLLRKLGYKIILISLYPSSTLPLPIENYVEDIFIIEKNVTPSKLNSFSFLFKNIKASICNIFYFKSDLITSFKLKKNVYIKLKDYLQKIKRYNFYTVICRTPPVCYYAEKINLKSFFGIKVVYDMVDSLTRFIYSLRNQNFEKKLKVLSYFFVNTERYLRNFNYITYITLSDALYSGHRNNVSVLPDITKDFYLFNTKTYQKIYDIILFGDWNYYPNKIGLIWFLNKIYPSLKVKNLKIAILGKGSEIFKNIYQDKNLNFFGEVDKNKFENILLSSKINISPVFIGAGYQNKVIDALAFGVPTIAHKIFKESDPLAPVLIFKDEKDLIKNINNLLEDENFYNFLQKKSKAYYLKIKEKFYKDNLFFFENL